MPSGPNPPNSVQPCSRPMLLADASTRSLSPPGAGLFTFSRGDGSEIAARSLGRRRRAPAREHLHVAGSACRSGDEHGLRLRRGRQALRSRRRRSARHLRALAEGVPRSAQHEQRRDAAVTARGLVALVTSLLALARPAPPIGSASSPSPIRRSGPTRISPSSRTSSAPRAGRIGGVEDVPTMRARLLGQASNATLSELDRAYGGALAVYQNGEFESSVRTLRAIVEDLESIPESDDAYAQWTRRCSGSRTRPRRSGWTATRGRAHQARADRSDAAPDPDQYSPGYRRRFEEVKGKIRALPKRRLTVLAEGKPGVVYVNGRNMGPAPCRCRCPRQLPGRGRGGRAPRPELHDRPRGRGPDGGARLRARRVAPRERRSGARALPAQRAYGIIRAGAWLGTDKLVVASRVSEGGAQFLLGSIFDVRRGALLREGSVRMVAGSVPAVNLGALASFLLTGQSSRDVKDRTREAPRELPRPLVVATSAPPSAPGQYRRRPRRRQHRSCRARRLGRTRPPAAPARPGTSVAPARAAPPSSAAARRRRRRLRPRPSAPTPPPQSALARVRPAAQRDRAGGGAAGHSIRRARGCVRPRSAPASPRSPSRCSPSSRASASSASSDAERDARRRRVQAGRGSGPLPRAPRRRRWRATQCVPLGRSRGVRDRRRGPRLDVLGSPAGRAGATRPSIF